MTSPSRMRVDLGDDRISSERSAHDHDNAYHQALSADQARRARLRVAASATDADDCRELLEMLGLLTVVSSVD